MHSPFWRGYNAANKQILCKCSSRKEMEESSKHSLLKRLCKTKQKKFREYFAILCIKILGNSDYIIIFQEVVNM